MSAKQTNLTIKINLENEAFQSEPSFEVVRILQKLVDKFKSSGQLEDTLLMDINGSKVGTVEIEED